jgi:hypothetical protein
MIYLWYEVSVLHQLSQFARVTRQELHGAITIDRERKYFTTLSHLCSIVMFEQPIELPSKRLLHCGTPNRNTH